MRYTDRSRIISYQTCPRKRYLEYEADGRGYQLDKLNPNLFVGSCVHRGLETLLIAAVDIDDPVPIDWNTRTEIAVQTALAFYDEGINKSPIDDEGEPLFIYYELRSLVEALIRVYAKVQLPTLLAEYEILEVEKELEFNLTDDIIFMSRPDALLRHRKTGEIYILSFKTAASLPSGRRALENWHMQNKTDMQGISETVAVEIWLDEEFKRNWTGNPADNEMPKVSGIKMEFLVKGSKIAIGKNAGWINNPLIHAWKHDVTGEYAVRYEYELPNGEKKKLGKGWNRINIWDEGDEALAKLIELVAEDDVDLLRSMIATPEAYVRNEGDIKSWQLQTIAQEQEIQQKIQDAPTEYNLEWLDKNFIQHRGSCFSYNSRCPFYEACWHGIDIHSSDFVEREINHEYEKRMFNV